MKKEKREIGEKERKRKTRKWGVYIGKKKQKRKRKLHNEYSISPVCEFPLNIFNTAA